MQLSDLIEIISIKNKVLHFKVKGFWSNAMVDTYGKQIFELWEKAVLSFNGQKFISLPDLSEFKSQEEKGQNLIASLMKFAQEHNLYHSVQYVPTALVRYGISQSSGKVNHDKYRTVAKTLDEAKSIVNKKLMEI